MRRLIVVVFACAAGCASAKAGSGGDAPIGSGTDAAGSGSADADNSNGPDANSCSHQPCSLSPQCGCAAGSACDLDNNNLATGGTTCVTAGTGMEASTCTGDTACAPGFTCVGSPARCEKWCAGDTDCTSGPGALCIINIVYGTPQMNVPGAKVCTTDCDPSSKTPAGCPATWGCHIYQENGGAMRLVTDCDPAGAGGVGASCSTNGSRDCQAGMDCINVTRGTTTTAECHPTCKCPSGNCAAGTCPSGAGSCGAFNPSVTIGTQEYGACL